MVISTESTQVLLGSMMIYTGTMNCIAYIGDAPFKFLNYQLSMVGYWLTMAMTGNKGLRFDFGEDAWETATTSKEGSRRANYQILTQGRSDKT